MAEFKNMIDRRRLTQGLFLGAAGLSTGFTLSGCSKPEEPAKASDAAPAAGAPPAGYTAPQSTVTAMLRISNWGDPADQAVYAKVAQRFKARYPNVTVKDEFTPITTWSEYVNKLLTQVAGGNAPDVINIAIEGVKLGISKKLFLPLTDYISRDASAKAMMANVDPALLSGLAENSTQYLLPSTWNTMLIYYNTKMFEAAGIARPADDWTWDDFLEIAKKLSAGTNSKKVFGFAMPYFNFGLTPWFYSNGTSELNADWTASNLGDPKMLESVTFIRDLVTKHHVAPQPKGADPYQLFPAGKAAMTGAGHWVVGAFKKAGFNDFDVLPWPRKAVQASVYGTAGFAVQAGSQNKDLAWEYIKELSSETTQQDWAKIGAATPASKAVAASADFLAAPPQHSDLYYAAISYAKPVAAPTIFNTLEPSVMRAMDSILSGADPVAALKTADREVSDAFAAAK